MKKIVLLFLFSCLIIGTNLQAQCECTDCPNANYVMGDEVASIASQITVATTGVDDLAINPLVSVNIDLHHDWLGDVSMSLVSPSGLHYALMGDDGNAQGECGAPAYGAVFTLVPGTANPLTPGLSYAEICNGTEYCIEGDWTLACGMGAMNIHNGSSPAPNCDLNDFNVAGHTVSGVWTLYVNCVCNAEFGSYLNNWGLNFQNEEEIECEEPTDPGTGGENIVIETTIFVGESGIACLPAIVEIINLCPEEEQNVAFNFDPPCVTYTGLTPGVDTLCILVEDEFGNTVEATIIVNVLVNPQPFVRPGDANNDGIVNSSDLLHIGIAFGATGIPRENASGLFEPQFATYWQEETQVSHVDYKFIDSNGDGLIGSADVQAIVQNYGLTHNENPNVFEPFIYENELLRITAEAVTGTQGSAVNIPISIQTVNGFLMSGIAFDAILNPEVFDLSSAEFYGFSEVFGSDSNEFIELSVIEGNTLHVAISHNDDFGTSSQGTIGTLSIDLLPNASTNIANALSLQAVKIMNAAEVAYPIGEPTDVSVTVIGDTVSTNNTWVNQIKVYPQPASSELHIDSGSYALKGVTLYDATGKMMQQIATTGDLTSINTSNYKNGVYLLALRSAEGTAMRKIVLLK